MARIRTVKPEFWTDPTMVALSFEARLFYIGLWNFADDHGCVENEPARLRMQILPGDDVNAGKLVRELVDAGRLQELVSADGDEFLRIKSWEKHQKIDNRSKPRFGDPDTWTTPEPAESHPIPPSPTEHSDRKGMEGKGNGPTNTVGPGEPEHDDGFDEFWNEYPRHHDTKATGGCGNKRTARKRWRAISAVERAEVVEAVGPYAKLCGPNGQKPKHAERFLINEAWQPYLPAARAGPPRESLCRLCDRPTTAPDHAELCAVFQ